MKTPSPLARQMFTAIARESGLDYDKVQGIMDVLHDEFGSDEFWSQAVNKDNDTVEYDDLKEAFDTARLPRCPIIGSDQGYETSSQCDFPQGHNESCVFDSVLTTKEVAK